MNIQHFMEWFEKQLIPNLPPKSVIVLDNAKYHNSQVDKAPNQNNRKDDMKRWLDRHNISYEQGALKSELYSLIKQHRPEPVYTTVLRLSVGHCELNPIEYSHVKWSIIITILYSYRFGLM